MYGLEMPYRSVGISIIICIWMYIYSTKRCNLCACVYFVYHSEDAFNIVATSYMLDLYSIAMLAACEYEIGDAFISHSTFSIDVDIRRTSKTYLCNREPTASDGQIYL